jgi:sulfide:quinone oxidoreductase
VAGHERVVVVGDAGSFPGPGWMPKQAHMADLQAAVAAVNLLADLDGRASHATFKVELMCIVDALDQGTMVWRTPERNVLLPPSRLFHWAKRGFERKYLQQYR